ncbi:MAG: Heat shock protein GrpE [uncultured Campylobacterales bacterium]|uniref:Protein GrpE n=1 Tax=uncultured Campylobacterales bacterium TaxID=352960 RepID=A0A6S6S7V8_9BACT|nr:MAG: Heat shock protein GrpE [uncultured Campylobacterales bacterium]
MDEENIDDLKQSYIDDNVDENIENSDEKESVTESIEELKAKNKELEEKFLRANAEFVNMQRRLEKQKADSIAYATQSFARDLLSVIDSLDLSIKNEEISLEDLKNGINITVDQFNKVFERAGITEIECEGEFDPNFHEAVIKVESEDKKSGEIVQVLQKGYKIKDRVLRAAMVSVAK